MWGAGFATGIGVGFAVGLIVGRLGVQQKPWSELTEKEKRIRKITVGVGTFILLVGITTLVWAVLSR